MPMSHHQRPTLGTRIHGAARMLEGAVTRKPAKERSGEQMMNGQTTSTAVPRESRHARKSRRGMRNY
jgi:hypothetical protein